MLKIKEIVNKFKFKKKKNNMDKVDRKNYYLILLITLFVILPLLSNNYFFGHDSVFHFANVDVMTKHFSLIPCAIRPVLAKGFGYGIGMFYQPLAHTVTSYINVIINNLYLSFKIINLLVVLLSATFMYKFSSKVFKEKGVALLSAFCYVTFPYFLSDLYIRFSYSEMLIFVFVPIAMIGLYNLLYEKDKEFYLYFIIGITGMIYSHLVLAVYFTILAIIFLLINHKLVFNKEVIKKLLIASIFIILFSLPYTIPMIENKSLGIYNVFTEGGMASANSVYNRSLNLSSYLDPTKGVRVYTFISIGLLILVTSLILNYKKVFNDKNKLMMIKSFIILTIVVIVLASKLFPWLVMPDSLLLIQFPWRLEVFLAFFISVLAGLGILTFDVKNRQIILIIVLVSILGSANSVIYDASFLDISKYKNDESVNGVGWNKDYFPVNLIDNYDYYQNRDSDLVLIGDGENVSFNIIKDSTPNLTADVSFKGRNIKVELPRIYYLGYKIRLDTGSEILNIDYYQNDKGFMEIVVPESGKLIVTYPGTKLRNVAFNVTGISILVGTGIYIISKKKNRVK